MKNIAKNLLIALMVMSMIGCTKTVKLDTGLADDTTLNASDLSHEENNQQMQVEAPVELLIWSYTDEILTEIKGFEEKYNAKVTVELQDINGLAPMAAGVIKSGQAMPDIIVCDKENLLAPQLDGLLVDLSSFAQEKNDDNMYKFVYDQGINEKGELSGLTYSVNPTAVFYRTDFAKYGLGLTEAEDVNRLFNDYSSLIDGSEKLKGNNIKFFADIHTLRYFQEKINWSSFDDNVDSSVDSSVDTAAKGESVRNYLETVRSFEMNEYTAYAREWSNDWLKGMYSPISNDIVNNTNVFSYVLPSWGLTNVLMLAGDSDKPIDSDELGNMVYNNTMGDWSLAEPVRYSNIGGSFIGINASSPKEEMAMNFLDYMIFDEDHLVAWLGESDVISSNKAVNAKQDFALGNRFLSSQNYHEFFRKLLADMETDYETNISSEKDKGLQEKLDAMTYKYMAGDYHTISEAIKSFESSETTAE